jgi:hypothetical protein
MLLVSIQWSYRGASGPSWQLRSLIIWTDNDFIKEGIVSYADSDPMSLAAIRNSSENIFTPLHVTHDICRLEELTLLVCVYLDVWEDWCKKHLSPAVKRCQCLFTFFASRMTPPTNVLTLPRPIHSQEHNSLILKNFSQSIYLFVYLFIYLFIYTNLTCIVAVLLHVVLTRNPDSEFSYN